MFITNEYRPLFYLYTHLSQYLYGLQRLAPLWVSSRNGMIYPRLLLQKLLLHKWCKGEWMLENLLIILMLSHSTLNFFSVDCTMYLAILLYFTIYKLYINTNCLNSLSSRPVADSFYCSQDPQTSSFPTKEKRKLFFSGSLTCQTSFISCF